MASDPFTKAQKRILSFSDHFAKLTNIDAVFTFLTRTSTYETKLAAAWPILYTESWVPSVLFEHC